VSLSREVMALMPKYCKEQVSVDALLNKSMARDKPSLRHHTARFCQRRVRVYLHFSVASEISEKISRRSRATS